MISQAISDAHITQLSSIIFFWPVLVLLLWRFWTFTILPILYPDDPKEFPYWTPVFGHLISFYKNPNALQTSARKYFNDSKQAFTITLAGTKLYILTNPKDISEAYMSSVSLSFDTFVKLLIRTCGSSKRVVERLYQDPPPSSKRHKSLGRAIHDLQVQQTSGQRLEDLSAVFVTFFEETLSFEKVAMNSRYRSKPAETGKLAPISLRNWCAEVVINASQKAYFGDVLSEIDSNLAQTFMEFDTRSWQLLYHFPRIISKPMYAAKDQLVNALTAYFETPVDRKTDAAWVTQLLEQEMRGLGFTDKEMGTLMMLQYWGINTNTHKACFWMLSHMLFEPGLLEVIRAETATAFSNGSLDLHYLEKSCPRLQGLWLEMLRLTVSSSSIRYIKEDTTIGGKSLRRGNVLINSCRQLHFNESIFGEDVTRFDSRRFVDNRSLETSSSWKPFGGGISLCPGRLIAKRAAIAFVALVLYRFDVKLAFPQPFPKPEDKTPDLGVFMSPDDLILTISQRVTE